MIFLIDFDYNWLQCEKLPENKPEHLGRNYIEYKSALSYESLAYICLGVELLFDKQIYIYIQIGVYLLII